MKYVGSAEFKANCLRLMSEMQIDGEPITVTRRGKAVAVVNPAEAREAAAVRPLASSFGLMKSDRYRFDIEPQETALDPDWETRWEADNPPELYARTEAKTKR